MCGIPRASSGNIIAIMFPSPVSSPASSLASSSSSSLSSLASRESYTLSFSDSETATGTKAVFQIRDPTMVGSFQECKGIDLRIEKHGDLTILSREQPAPLHHFQLRPSLSASRTGEMEFSLPKRLDLGVSEQGIVGRQVTVTTRGLDGEILQMGSGIVGYD